MAAASGRADAPDASEPLRLWHLHRSLHPGEHREVVLPPGLTASRWADVLHGAGLTPVGALPADGRPATIVVRRERTLADTVGPDLTVLVVGLNPSPYAADAGVGFARPGNRFWPAAQRAGLVERDRDPLEALARGVGMTDLVKRVTPRAAELTATELRAGLGRVTRLAEWLAPRAICVLGVTGWRTASGDRGAGIGWQPDHLGGSPVYVMPNPSGLNAHTTVDDLAAHLRTAASRAADGRL